MALRAHRIRTTIARLTLAREATQAFDERLARSSGVRSLPTRVLNDEHRRRKDIAALQRNVRTMYPEVARELLQAAAQEHQLFSTPNIGDAKALVHAALEARSLPAPERSGHSAAFAHTCAVCKSAGAQLGIFPASECGAVCECIAGEPYAVCTACWTQHAEAALVANVKLAIVEEEAPHALCRLACPVCHTGDICLFRTVKCAIAAPVARAVPIPIPTPKPQQPRALMVQSEPPLLCNDDGDLLLLDIDDGGGDHATAADACGDWSCALRSSNGTSKGGDFGLGGGDFVFDDDKAAAADSGADVLLLTDTHALTAHDPFRALVQSPEMRETAHSVLQACDELGRLLKSFSRENTIVVGRFPSFASETAAALGVQLPRRARSRTRHRSDATNGSGERHCGNCHERGHYRPSCPQIRLPPTIADDEDDDDDDDNEEDAGKQ